MSDSRASRRVPVDVATQPSACRGPIPPLGMPGRLPVGASAGASQINASRYGRPCPVPDHDSTGSPLLASMRSRTSPRSEVETVTVGCRSCAAAPLAAPAAMPSMTTLHASALRNEQGAVDPRSAGALVPEDNAELLDGRVLDAIRGAPQGRAGGTGVMSTPAVVSTRTESSPPCGASLNSHCRQLPARTVDEAAIVRFQPPGVSASMRSTFARMAPGLRTRTQARGASGPQAASSSCGGAAVCCGSTNTGKLWRNCSRTEAPSAVAGAISADTSSSTSRKAISCWGAGLRNATRKIWLAPGATLATGGTTRRSAVSRCSSRPPATDQASTCAWKVIALCERLVTVTEDTRRAGVSSTDTGAITCARAANPAESRRSPLPMAARRHEPNVATAPPRLTAPVTSVVDADHHGLGIVAGGQPAEVGCEQPPMELDVLQRSVTRPGRRRRCAGRGG